MIVLSSDWCVTDNPHSQWAIQQLRETFAFDESNKYVIRDNDAIFSEEFKQTFKRFRLKDMPTAPARLGKIPSRAGQ